MALCPRFLAFLSLLFVAAVFGLVPGSPVVAAPPAAADTEAEEKESLAEPEELEL
jgi:hypothetical protein